MVRFAPINIPLSRRLQTAAVCTALLGFPSICISSVFILWWFIPLMRPVLIIYLIWIFFDKTPFSGGRAVLWIRTATFWKYFAAYFPAQLVRTKELDPSKRYLLGIHPHGIISLAAWCSFLSHATGFNELFPGIDLRVLTVSSNFYLPVWREFIQAMGLIDAQFRSALAAFKKGASVAIVVGGAAEALNARPGTNDLTLARRKGFVKLAMKAGASLVPVFSFGENDLYDQVPNPKGSWLRNFQDRTKRFFGYSLPLFKGRGIFQYDFGVLPYRTPLATIVGNPIDMPQSDAPTDEDVDKYHKLYVEELQRIYDLYKDKFDPHRKSDLRLVD
eukprot:GILJ01007946.1.p1 GENE.GILJ01007946.1~~GILJ01007946.1.p1  ORF type:complete len:331 (+),score=35.09 GILJ01007946.1:1176-2168(+)